MFANRGVMFEATQQNLISHRRLPGYKVQKLGTHAARALGFNNFTTFIAVALCAFSSLAAAQSQEPSPQMGVSLEPANSGSPTDGEFIDYFTGKVAHEVTDLLLPGSAGLDIKVARAYNKNPLWQAGSPFGALDWEISVPRIYLSQPAQDNWCEDPATPFWIYGDPPNVYQLSPAGILLSVPGENVRALLGNTGAAHRYVTNDFWKADCISASGKAGRGFKVTSPAGLTYYFDLSFRDSAVKQQLVCCYANLLLYAPVQLVASKVEDRFGNSISYEYVGDPSGRLHVKRIASSDGRDVVFTYQDAGKKWASYSNVYLLDSFSSGGRAWTFHYENDHLKEVTRPDATTYEYIYGGNGASESPIFKGYLASAKNPAGATVTYDQIPRRFTTYYSNGTSQVDLYSLRTRTWSDASSTYSKTFTYSDAGDGRQYTTASSANKAERYLVDASQGVFRGRIFERQAFNPVGALLETTSYQYGSLRSLGASYSSDVAGNTAAQSLTVLTSKNIVRGTDTFSTAFRQHNEFGQPREIVETGPTNSSPSSRLTTLEYLNDQTLWVLGQISSRRVSNSDGSGAYQAEATTFDALDRPFQIWKNGLLTETRGYDAESNLASSKDGLGRETKWLNYYRGSPKNVLYPDSTTSSQVINDFGEQTSFTDENSHITGYQRDALGRVKRIDYPTGDIQAWVSRTTARGFTAASEFGHPVGTWREVVTHRGFEQTTYHDGFGKPVHIRERDIYYPFQVRNRRFQYDDLGRKTFEGDWSEGDLALGSGTYITYDAIGRVVERTHTQGAVLERSAYLADNKKRTTDADGKVTTSTYQAFGEPDYSRPTKVEAPEGQTTSIHRDLFGKITSVTQSGLYGTVPVSATRTFAYDANQRLCRRLDPESGSTLWGYDPASQIKWEAKGQPATVCATVQPADAAVFDYDLRGRKKTDTYPQATESVAYDYDPAGNLKKVSNDVAIWSYAYNKRNLLESEEVLVDGKSFLLDRIYDDQGRLGSLITPSRTIQYRPDAWGRPTDLTDGGSGVIYTIRYHPNGIPKSYYIGGASATGISYDLTLNERQRPDVQETSNGTTLVRKYKYQYSNAGDLTFLDDEADGADDATLTYDDLHRLKTATGPWGNYTYTYDPLNNIQSRTGTSSLTYAYNSANRLDRITGAYPRTYTYNNRGAIAGDGTRTFNLNYQGQITGIVGVASYAYDGNGKRIKTTHANGAIEYALYDRSGALVYTLKGPSFKLDLASSNSSSTASSAGESFIAPATASQAAADSSDPVQDFLDAVNSAWETYVDPVWYAVFDPIIPKAPTGLVPTEGQKLSPDGPEHTWGIFSWNSAEFATSYELVLEEWYPQFSRWWTSTNTVTEPLQKAASQHRVTYERTLYSGKSYRYQVRACNYLGCGAFTTKISFSIDVGGPPGQLAILGPGTTAPPGPTEPNKTFNFRWALHPEGGVPEYYVVSVKETSTGQVINLTQSNPSLKYLTVTVALYGEPGILKAATAYSWTVKACNRFGCSVESARPYFVTVGGAKPATPSNLTPGSSSSSPGPTIETDIPTLAWNAVNGAEYYKLRVYDYRINAEVTNQTVTSTSHTIDLSEDTEYMWGLRACNSYGCSAESNRFFKVPELLAQTDYLQLNGVTVLEIKLVDSRSTATYLHSDLLGSPRMATDSSKKVLWQEHYDPYGQGLNGVSKKIGYTGHAYDAESGYTYMQARFYDPLVGRFLSIDPEDFKDSSPFTFNRYSYANNNPYRYKDPNGESPIDIAFLVVDVGKLAAAFASGNPAAIQSAAIDLGFSAVGLISPLPGTGQALKIARLGDKAADVAKGLADGKSVLGHYPEYKELAENLNARRFNVPQAAWNKMSETERWTANQKFLDRMISRGDEITLSTPLDKVRPGSYFARELEYMGSKGYVPNADGTRLIKP